VSTQRAQLGAAQNQMESAINSLGVSVENLSASESRIRDADIAQVSSELVTRQIMQQAGVAVLAQANSAPQSVLKLLQ
jgi:flagellin